MAVLSILTNSFWFSSPHSFPFLKIPSVSIGDTLFLPLFNTYATQMFLYNTKNITDIKLFVSVIIFAAANFSIQRLIHIDWSMDSYTGFMDLSVGVVSEAGWIHAVYSSIQTTIIILFLFLWLKNKNNDHLFKLGIIGWRIISLYFCLGIIDFAVKVLFVFQQQSISQSIMLEWPLAIKLCGMLFVSLLILKHNQKQLLS